MGQATPSATGLPPMLSSQASYVIVSGFRAALDLDTYPFSNLIRPRCAERLNPVGVSLVPRPFSYAHAREGKEGSGK